MRLNNKVVMVTGGASGIGAACAKRFSEEGATVVIADLSSSDGQATASALERGLFLPIDVRDPESVQSVVASTVEKFGRIDVLMNNAGIDVETASIADGDLDVWQRTMEINMFGVLYGMRFAIQQMKKQSGGVILNTASTAGMVAFPNRPAYSASKASIIQLSKVAAIENAEFNIRVNALCPGCVQTPILDKIIERSESPEATLDRIEHMNPIPGILSTEDIASAAVFMISDESRFITGVALPIDGGYTAR